MLGKKEKSLQTISKRSSIASAVIFFCLFIFLFVFYGVDSYIDYEQEKNSLLVNMVARQLDSSIGDHNYLSANNIDNSSIWHPAIEKVISPLSDSYSLIIADDQGLPLYVSNNIVLADKEIVPAFDQIKDDNFALTKSHLTGIFSKNIPVAWDQMGSTGWMVILYESRSLEQQFPIVMLIIMMSIFILNIIYTTIINIARSKKICNSVNYLTWQFNRVADGMPAEPLKKQQYREFTSLANSFSKMNNQLQERNSLLQQQAFTDNLTGLANRTMLMNHITEHILNNPDEEMIVFFIDLDDFKRINDSYGHPFGDQILIQVSSRLNTLEKYFCLISRIGGDEFVLLMRGFGPDIQMRDYADQLIQLLKVPFHWSNKTLRINFSMGIALYPKDGDLAFNLLQCADMALYAAKAAGKSTYRFFDEQMRIDLDRQVYLENALDYVVERDELQLNYQMQIMAGNLVIRGFEALIRWNSRELGYVTALELISVAEENGKIIQIGEWIMRQACSTIARINKKYNLNLVMSVNVSPLELRNPDYASHLQKIIKESGIDPSWLELEITEQVLVDCGTEIIDMLERIHELGVSIALDDFGTGYSSLSYLHQLPVQTIKIDQSFISSASADDRNWQMIESILFMTEKLSLFTIAEGIEDKNTYEKLNQMGCDCMQGFYFCRPLPESQLIKVIESRLNKK